MSLPTYRWERVGSIPEELVLVNNDTDEVLGSVRADRAFGWWTDSHQYFSKGGAMRAALRKHGISDFQATAKS